MTEQQEITTSQAVNLLVQAVNLAQNKGAYSLNEAALISQAIRTLTTPSDTTQPVQEVEEQVSEEQESEEE